MSAVSIVIAELEAQRKSSTDEPIKCVNADLQAALLELQASSGATLPSASVNELYGGSGSPNVADVVTVGSGLDLTGGVLTATGGGSGLPAAATNQIYGGSGVAGNANVVSLGVNLSLSGSTLTATNTSSLPAATIASLYSGSGSAGTADVISVTAPLAVAAGALSIGIATNAALGVMQADGATIDITSGGIISVPIATTSLLGLVKPDGATITITGGGEISAVNDGTVTSVSIVNANGFNGSVALPTTTPAITIETTVTGFVYGNGTDLIAATIVPPLAAAGSMIGVNTATVGTLGVVEPDGDTIDILAGVISVPTATTSSLGLVKPDGATIDVSGGGIISVPIATTSLLGLVKPDGTTITITGGGEISAVNDGTVTTLSIVSANGFAGTVANPTTTPAITLETTITGVIYGDGTQLETATIGTNLNLTGSTLSATNTTSLPVAALAQLYGGSTTAGTAAIVNIGGALQISGGTLSTITATAGNLGVVEPDGSSIIITGGVISAPNLSGQLSITISLTSAQILGANASPVIMIPAPGPGKAIVPNRTITSLEFNSIAYTGGTNAGLYYQGSAINASTNINGVSGLAGSASQIQIASSSATAFPATTVTNKALEFTCTAAFLAGNSTANITILYEIITL